jgi:hypothetical protein
MSASSSTTVSAPVVPNFELKHIRGIPYYLNGTIVHTFEISGGKPIADKCIAIGTYDAATNNITYYSDWRERIQPNLDAFRTALVAKEREKLRQDFVKPQKPRKAARNPRKTGGRTKSVKSE